jgi:hypothetical protein
MHLQIAVETAGNAEWRGVLPAIYDRTGVRIHEPVCLYTSLETGSCLGLPISQVTARNVRVQVNHSNSLFASYQERAAQFVLRNFSRSPKSLGLKVLVRA